MGLMGLAGCKNEIKVHTDIPFNSEAQLKWPLQWQSATEVLGIYYDHKYFHELNIKTKYWATFFLDYLSYSNRYVSLLVNRQGEADRAKVPEF